MAKLAIKGHPTRGKEVIEILEMLGGKNDGSYRCALADYAYSINGQGIIDWYIPHPNSPLVIFTLEEFLEKFPYKVGDRVLYKTYGIYLRIKSMLWNEEKEQVFYRLDSKKLYVASEDELQPYKEDTMDKVSQAVFDTNAQCCNIMNHLIDKETMEEQIKIDIPKGYEFAGVDDDKKQVVFTKIGYYPKTYEECCDIIEYPHNVVGGYKAELLSSFQNLLICRDVYWKIAGEQMGLGKPWEPDYTDDNIKYIIGIHRNHLDLNCTIERNHILIFPSEEIRDAFLENFKDLIEDCKALL